MATTDDQNEFFDIVDENDNVIGRATRGEVHKDKTLIHRSVGVFVFNDNGELFIQQRSAGKDIDPLKWAISCAGHVMSGDTYKNSAQRELLEELGVDLEIEPVAKYLCVTVHETEMVMLYRTKVQPCTELHLNKEEIAEGKFFTRKGLNDAVISGAIDLAFWDKIALEKIGWI